MLNKKLCNVYKPISRFSSYDVNFLFYSLMGLTVHENKYIQTFYFKNQFYKKGAILIPIINSLLTNNGQFRLNRTESFMNGIKKY